MARSVTDHDPKEITRRGSRCRAVIRANGGNAAQAARVLGLARNSLLQAAAEAVSRDSTGCFIDSRLDAYEQRVKGARQ